MIQNSMNAFFEVLINSMNDAVTIVDADGIVLYWNEAAEKTYEITREEIVGKLIGDFFKRESLMLYQVMESGIPVRNVYHEPRPGMHVTINTDPVYNEKQELIGAISIEQNITSYVKLSAELYSKPSGQNLNSFAFPFKKEEIDESSAMSTLGYPLLLVGDSGVGKKSMAEWLHQSGGKQGNFVSVSCSSIPGGLIDSELFGFHGEAYGKKADTRLGKLGLAHNGTIYLRDLHTIPAATQEKLAQAISERKYFPVGSTTSVPLTCRILASAPAPIASYVAQGHIRQDLFYAFQTIYIPSLQERKQELPELCRLFLSQAAEHMGKRVPELSSEVMTALTSYNWPGNLPELKNVMEHIIIVSISRPVSSQDLPSALRLTTLNDLTQQSVPLHVHSEEVERAHIIEALERTNGNKARAARILSISRGALYYKIKQYGLDD
jgi:sigma-54 dependent transcriptional regulator, acetoin dehydrogenase operon transcriptional activator AcoR